MAHLWHSSRERMNDHGIRGTAGALDIWTNEWGKFSQYEIHNDHIRPAPGAHFERYDPWEFYREGRKISGGQPPYQTLIDLAITLGAYRDSESGHWGYRQWLWNSAQRAQVLSWCARFGLLGILPHVALSIDLPPPSRHPGSIFLSSTRLVSSAHRGYIRIRSEERRG